MIVDIGKRQGAQMVDIDWSSYRISGLPWMRMKKKKISHGNCNGNILNSEELEIDHIKQEVPSYKEFENAMNNHHENSSWSSWTL